MPCSKIAGMNLEARGSKPTVCHQINLIHEVNRTYVNVGASLTHSFGANLQYPVLNGILFFGMWSKVADLNHHRFGFNAM